MSPRDFLMSLGYKRLDSQDGAGDNLDERDLFVEKEQPIQIRRERSIHGRLVSFLPWALAITFALLFLRECVSLSADTFERGWSTDFERTIFTGAPAIHKNGTVYVPHPDPVRYVGTPSPELDHAWSKLIGGRYFLITTEEAKATWGASYKEHWSLDVFHTLHCLNQLREKLHPEYYTHHKRGKEETNIIHEGKAFSSAKKPDDDSKPTLTTNTSSNRALH
ncbi:hypothetical protein F5Y16DRAFT_403713 [Xylariaceae sp. FL0255]|nr:hypothetical protein F5Y16DRAFT_403713 [Xylariaceae sp. FL0255]